MIVPILVFAWFFQPAPTFIVSGTVVNRVTGKPLSNAHVSLGGAQVDPVVTDADGRFRFEGVKQGKFSLVAERQGFARQGYRQRSLAIDFSTGIVTGEHESTEDLVFGLIPGAVITGSVTDTPGMPVQGLTVRAYRVVGGGSQRRVPTAFWSGATDDRGQYRIPSLPAGLFVVAFSGRIWQNPDLPASVPMTYPATYFPGTTAAERAALVSVEMGKEVRADVVLAPVSAVQVQGHVVLPDVKGNFYVTLTTPGPFGSEPIVGMRTPVVGSEFVLRDVPEGHYFVNLWDAQNRPVGRRVVDVGSSDTAITIGETPFAQVSEKVEIRGTPRSPTSPTVLRLFSDTTQAVRVLDAEGRASVDALPPGQYEVSITKGTSLALISIEVDGATQSSGRLNIPETGSVHLSIIADATASYDIAGHVFRGDKPEGGLLAMLVSKTNWDNVTSYRFDQSDSDGSFTWRAVPSGEYLMFAFENGEPLDYASSEVIRALAPKSQRVNITGDPKQIVTVQLTAR